MTREITFAGIDDMNRPVFKVIVNGAKPYYICDCDNLFPWGAIEEGVKRFYKEIPRERVDMSFFGDHFDCEPDGRRLKPEVIEDFYKYVNGGKMKTFIPKEIPPVLEIPMTKKELELLNRCGFYLTFGKKVRRSFLFEELFQHHVSWLYTNKRREEFICSLLEILQQDLNGLVLIKERS